MQFSKVFLILTMIVATTTPLDYWTIVGYLINSSFSTEHELVSCSPECALLPFPQAIKAGGPARAFHTLWSPVTKHPLVEQRRPGSYTCTPLYPCFTCRVNMKVHVKTPGNVFSSLRVEKSVRRSRAKRWIKSEGLKDYKEPNSLP